MVDPKESHLAAVKQIFRYLKGTADLGLWYPKDTGFELTTYSDAYHAWCMLDRKSTSGHIQFLGDKLVSWASKKQLCVSTSTAEAEYVAAASCCSQILWTRTQLQDYGFKFDKIPIYCDSKSAIAISTNPVQNTKTKHIDVSHTVASSTVVSTERLSGSGVRLPDFVSKHHLDGALKAVESQLLEKFFEEIVGVKRVMKGKDPLLSQAPTDQTDVDLTGLLRAQQPPVSQAVPQSQAEISSKRHDHDSDHDHEGEKSKRQRTSGGFEHQIESIDLESDNEDASQTQNHNDSQRQECMEIVLYVDPNAEPMILVGKGRRDGEISDFSDDENDQGETTKEVDEVGQGENILDGVFGDINIEALNVLYVSDSPEDIHISPLRDEILEVSDVVSIPVSVPASQEIYVSLPQASMLVQSDILTFEEGPPMSNTDEPSVPNVSEANARFYRNALRMPFLEEDKKIAKKKHYGVYIH
ncbi:hypothetical protein L6452_22202 [Arctium lappa]|uniref:Uncharacterized protein n=1 Tax=Arctium lappa TaxID=4217 RepID=A0ACB9AYC0_ARCLA|nr:hypothetical protein L6452_22202 [Arctium lappa]